MESERTGHSVLLLEDDPDDALLLETALRSQTASGLRPRYSVRREATLAAALATVARESVDIAVVDLTVPDSRGIDTVGQLRDAAPDMALVVLTGHDDDALALAALRAGAQDFLVKGRISDALLERSIRYSIERKLTERQRQLERERAERDILQEQLRHSQRMEAVGRLAGGVAHDFNNLLTVILGHAQLLDSNLEREESRGSAQEIVKAAERASRLTGQLLAFSRQQPMSPRVLDLNALVADLQSMVSRLLGETIILTTHLDDALPHVRADRGHLEQVLLNLAVNARDAMPGGGKLSIRTAIAQVDEQTRQTRPYVKPGRYVQISVSDAGCGMTDEVRARIFEPFFTTKEAGRGTGLGLSMVYGIVKQAEGYIWCTSVPNSGTRFDIYLPATDAPLDLVPEQEAPAAAVPSSASILVVEDEPAVRKIVTRNLRAAGYNVFEAANGTQALKVARELQQPIDLLITDMVMPDLSGRDVASRLCERFPATAVIYMSGYTEDDAVRRTGLMAHEGFLQKPFVAAELLVAVQKALGGTSPTPAP